MLCLHKLSEEPSNSSKVPLVCNIITLPIFSISSIPLQTTILFYLCVLILSSWSLIPLQFSLTICSILASKRFDLESSFWAQSWRERASFRRVERGRFILFNLIAHIGVDALAWGKDFHTLTIRVFSSWHDGILGREQFRKIWLEGKWICGWRFFERIDVM